MQIKTHHVHAIKIAEVISDDVLISNAEDGLELLGNIYYQDFDKLVLHAKNISPVFFDLKNGIAGEILQKFSNYRIQLFIVGDFTIYSSKSFNDFMYESNKAKHINFVKTLEEALKSLSTI